MDTKSFLFLGEAQDYALDVESQGYESLTVWEHGRFVVHVL